MDMEYLGSFLVVMLGGFLLGLFAATIRGAQGHLGRVFSGKLGVAMCIITGIISTAFSFSFSFPAFFWVLQYALQRNILLLFVGIGLSIVGAIGGILGCHVLFWGIKKAKMRKNPVLQEVYSIAKKKNATAVICCTDGVLILFGNVPEKFLINSKENIECRSKAAFDSISWQPTLTQDIIQAHTLQYEQILFADRQYELMDCDNMETFSRTLCDVWGKCELRMQYKKYSYSTPSTTYTTNAPYHLVNGNLNGGPKTYTASGDSFAKMQDAKCIVIKKFISARQTQVPIAQPPKKRW